MISLHTHCTLTHADPYEILKQQLSFYILSQLNHFNSTLQPVDRFSDQEIKHFTTIKVWQWLKEKLKKSDVYNNHLQVTAELNYDLERYIALLNDLIQSKQQKRLSATSSIN